MNERIKQLAEQAGFRYIKDEGIGWAGNYNSSLPKFAELIIWECVSNLEVTSICFDGDVGRGIRTAARLTREHFGVDL